MIHRSHKSRLMSGFARESDIPAILTLQVANLADNLSAAERKREGFVGIETTEAQLKMLILSRMVVAVHEGSQLVGYLIVATQDQARHFTAFLPLLRKFPKLRYREKALTTYKALIGVQGVVAKPYRSRGVAELLHRAGSQAWGSTYELLVSEASMNNTRSRHVHIDKIGWEPIHRHRKDAGVEGNDWLIIVYNLRAERPLPTNAGS